MSRIIITMSRTIIFRLLAHAPEELQREAKEDARKRATAGRVRPHMTAAGFSGAASAITPNFRRNT
jgi:hypothetical protein